MHCGGEARVLSILCNKSRQIVLSQMVQYLQHVQVMPAHNMSLHCGQVRAKPCCRCATLQTDLKPSLVGYMQAIHTMQQAFLGMSWSNAKRWHPHAAVSDHM